MDISQDHKVRKKVGYWSNLVEGETGIYKAEAIDGLLSEHFPSQCEAVLDIGCGTSVIAQTLRERLNAPRMVFMDYDPVVIDDMRTRVKDPTVEWKVGDIFKIGRWNGWIGASGRRDWQTRMCSRPCAVGSMAIKPDSVSGIICSGSRRTERHRRASSMVCHAEA